ncbi:MAG TPA: branched-chain amino acid ABC transporter permease [bacterium]|nr:branched-chain amino acid ABC transporter permease [bacterium]
MQVLFDQLMNGLTAGAEIALIAAGLSLMFGVLEIVNFAHGELYMLGAIFLYIAESSLGFPYRSAAVLSVATMLPFGALFYAVVVHRILNRGWQVQLVATLAVSVLLVNLVIVVLGAPAKLVPSPLMTTYVIGGMRISEQRILVLITAVIAFVLLFCFFRFAKLGKAMRAVAQNREAASVVGIQTERVGLAAVVASCLLAGVAGATIAPLYNVQPSMGTAVIVKAFAAVIMGGFGNVTGAIVSAVVLGLVEAFSIAYIASDYADLVVFGVMILVLVVRPQGVFGRVVRR